MIAVGIDVSKSKSTIAILDSTGKPIQKPTEYQHSNSQITHLITLLDSFPDDVRIVMEATGHYHLPILKALLEADLFVSVVNPYLMKKYGDNEIRRTKTDKKDALRIARYAMEKSHSLQPYSIAALKYSDLKFLSRQYNQCVKIKVKTRVYLGNLLDETMPGIQGILSSRTSNPDKNLLYKVIEKYHNFNVIKNMSQKRFINSYIKLAERCGCRSDYTKALMISELACDSITTRASDTYTLTVLEQYVAMVKQSENACNTILKQMQAIAYTLPEYPVVRAMNGVGDKLAPQLIAEIGDIRRFKSGRALNAYAGNDAPAFQSGQYESQNRHISKRGSTYLRKSCFEVMQALKMHKPEEDPVYLFIVKKEEEGKPSKVAKMAGVNKFLRLYYAKVMELYSS